MPKIPDDIGTYGGGPAIQPRRGVVQGPRDPRIDAVAELGDTIGRIGERVQEREDKLNYARAKTEYLKQKIQIESEFDNDNDYATFGDRYKEKITKARSGAANLIRNPTMRESFQLDTDVDIEQGLAVVGKKAFAREADNGRANLTSLLDENQKLILSTKDPLARESAYKNVSASIDTAVENNYLDREAGANLKRKFAEESALGEFTSQTAQSQLDMIKNNHPALAFIPADKRKQLEERAASAILSQTFMQKRIEKMQRAEIYDGLADQLESVGGDITQIPAKTFLALSPEQQLKLRQYGTNLASGKYNVTDVTKYHDLKHMAANPATREAFLNKDLTEELDGFAPAERKELINLQARLNNKDPETEQILDGYRSIGQRLNDTLIQAGVNTAPKKESQEAKSLALLRDRIEKGLIAEKQRTGKKELSADEEQKVIDRELIKEKTPGWFGTGIGSGERFTFQVEVDDIPDDARAQIEDALNQLGQPVTDQNIVKLYVQQRNRSNGR